MAERITIGIGMKDIEFAHALARNLDSDFDVDVTRVNTGEHDIFITDDSSDRNRNVLYLSDSRDDGGIYRYEGARRIRKQIISLYCMLYDDYVLECSHSSCSVITVSSCAGGSGCTSVALGIARMLSEQHSVLYMTFDDIPYQKESAGEAVSSLNRLIYIMDDMRFDINSLNTCIWTDTYGCCHFRYMKPYNILNMMDKSEIQKFISQLCGHYEYIIADTGSRITPLTDAVYMISDKVISVDVPSVKYGEYAARLESAGVRNVIHVNNMCKDEDAEGIGILANPEADMAGAVSRRYGGIL